MPLRVFSGSVLALLLTGKFVGPPSGPAIPQGNALTYQVPEGWNQMVDRNTGVITLMPGGLAFGRVAVVTVFSPEPYSGSAAAYHDEIMRRATANGRLLEALRTRTAGGFLATWVRQLMPNGIQLWVTIYTARWSDRGQALVFSANAADVESKYLPAADAMVRSIVVPQALAGPPVAPQLPPNANLVTAPSTPTATAPCLRPTGIEICPKPVPPPDQVVPIVGAYLSAGPRTSFSVDPRDPGVRSRVSTTILLLFANGVAARSSAMKDGTDGTYWAEGFATMDPRDPSQLGARRAGRWSEHGDTVSIAWQIGPAVSLTRDGNTLKEQYSVWTPYPSVDGLRLEGRFERDLGAQVDIPGYQPTPQVLTLRQDGTFTADGVDIIMGGTVVNPGFPEHGSGTYEIARWSLILRFTTGFVQSINLLLGEGDRADPDGLVLNGNYFGRRKP